MALDKNLRALLEARNLSVTELAKRASVPKTNIQSWLNGSSPDIFQLDKVAQVLGVSFEELAFNRKPPELFGELVDKFEVHSGTYEVSIKKIISKNKQS